MVERKVTPIKRNPSEGYLASSIKKGIRFSLFKVSYNGLREDKFLSGKEMPEFELSIEPHSFRQAPPLPQEWVTMVSKLNPITAAVVWQVLNGTITPATIALAKTSPDRERFMLIGIIAGGNANACEEISEMAREELDEILTSVVPGYYSRRIRH